MLDVETLPIMRRWYITHRDGKRLSPMTSAFKKFLLEEGAALLGQIPVSATASMPSQKQGWKRATGQDARRGTPRALLRT